MNFRIVLHQLGLLLMLLSGAMLLVAGGAFTLLRWFHQDFDNDARDGFLITGSAGLLVGALSWVLTRRGDPYLGRRETLLLVSISWLLGAALAALPFLHWARISPLAADDHPYRSFWSCYFESMSGLTTTGATVLADVEGLPSSLILWRAVLHWVGGLGVLVLFVAALPSLGAGGTGGKSTVRSEIADASRSAIRVQVRHTARNLALIYSGLTIVQVLALLAAGMGFFGAVCHAFSSSASGGFSSKNISFAHYQSLPINTIIMIFLILAGVNYAHYDRLLRNGWRAARGVLRDPELRLYFILMIGGTLVLMLALYSDSGDLTLAGGEREPLTTGTVLHHSAFTTVSMQTTSGLATADAHGLPFLAKAMLVFLIFVGGCAGSTAAGFKVMRLWIVFKVLHREAEKIFRPQIVRPVRVLGSVLDEDRKLATMSYVIGYVMIFAAGSLAIMLFESAVVSDQLSAISNQPITYQAAALASLSSLSNVGPAIALSGTYDYGAFTTPSLIIMSLLMALGRLEMFAIIVLFMPRFWRGAS